MAIYDRLPGETVKAYDAFCAYRDMGVERSLRDLGEQLNKATTVVARWSVKYNWMERVSAWDTDQDYLMQKEAIKSRQKEYREQLSEFRRNHLQVGKAAFKSSATCVKQIMDFMEKNESILTLDDANKAANIVRSLMPVADLWAKALAVDKLLERLQNEDG
jgi:hypothetical protein